MSRPLHQAQTMLADASARRAQTERSVQARWEDTARRNAQARLLDPLDDEVARLTGALEALDDQLARAMATLER